MKCQICEVRIDVPVDMAYCASCLRGYNALKAKDFLGWSNLASWQRTQEKWRELVLEASLSPLEFLAWKVLKDEQ